MKDTWVCPKCDYRIITIGSVEVAHRCTERALKLTYLRKEQDDKRD